MRNKAKKIIVKAGHKTLPPHSTRRRLVRGTLDRMGILARLGTSEYKKWIAHEEPSLLVADIKDGPVISIVTPCFNTPDKYIEPLIESVKAQTYPHWQLCLADGSTRTGRSKKLEKLAQTDERILYKKLNKNAGIAGNTNEAIKMATGQYIVFMDHDDLLASNALAEVAAVIHNDPEAEFIYSDEDLVDEKGKTRVSPFIKHGWSPDLLLCCNYITHMVCVKTTLVKELGGIRKGFEGAQDYDFVLRATEKAKTIHHIPRILYHWRMAEGSTAKDIKTKQYAIDSGKKAVEEALKRRGLQGSVDVHALHTANYKVTFKRIAQEKVAIILSEEALASHGQRTLHEILAQTPNKYQIFVPRSLAKLAGRKVTEYPDGLTTAQVVETLDKKIDRVVVISKAVLPTNKAWVEELIGPLEQPEVSAVCGLIVNVDGSIVDYGLLFNGFGFEQPFFGSKPELATYTGFPDWPRNFSSISGAVVAFDKSRLPKTNIYNAEFFHALYKQGHRLTGCPYAQFVEVPSQVTQDGMFNPNLVRHKDHLGLIDDFAKVKYEQERH